MPIKRLHIQGVRNLAQVAIENCGAVNIFTGSNGSGKTSLLEAIFILARALLSQQPIQHRYQPPTHPLRGLC